MREWPESHPKAKAMARRKSEIINAAKRCFIRTGYAGTTMETIADAAGISLMTLYRFAESKEDLFAATVTDACRARDENERQYYENLVNLPVREMLITRRAFVSAPLEIRGTAKCCHPAAGPASEASAYVRLPSALSKRALTGMGLPSAHRAKKFRS